MLTTVPLVTGNAGLVGAADIQDGKIVCITVYPQYETLARNEADFSFEYSDFPEPHVRMVPVPATSV